MSASSFFRAKLRLSVVVVPLHQVLLKNLVAYELLPGVEKDTVVKSYNDLMQLPVERLEDLKELRERKIVYNQLGSDEEALDVFKDIKTYVASNDELFFEVREQIEENYNNRIKTWNAELILTHFSSPWAVIAFLAAAFINALTAAQLHYAVHPPSTRI